MKKKITNQSAVQGATRRWAPLFLGPVVAAFIIGFVWPFAQGMWLSLCKFRTISNAKFIGFGNYISAFQDESFAHSFWYTGPCLPSCLLSSSTCWPSPWPTS